MTDKLKFRGIINHSKEQNKIVIDSIKEATIILMQQKPYQEITITEICKLAGVSRMGFYGNFKNVEDVLGKIIISIHRNLFDLIGNPFEVNLKTEWYETLFSEIHSNANTLKIILNSSFKPKYEQIVNEIVLQGKNLSAEQKYQRIVWVGGLINIVTYWLNNEDISIKELAKECKKTLSKIKVKRG